MPSHLELMIVQYRALDALFESIMRVLVACAVVMVAVCTVVMLADALHRWVPAGIAAWRRRKAATELIVHRARTPDRQ